jgi:hypothetical protein
MVNTSANRNSFQARVKEEIADTTNPGADRSRRMRNSATTLVYPSTMVRSSRSQEMGVFKRHLV